MIGDTNLFSFFPKVNYRFGDNELPIRFEDLSVYIDIFDQVREYSSFYESYQIQNNERPDHTSQYLYGTTDHYWTFFLLNEKLRLSGWPLDNFRLFDQAKQYYPHIVATTSGAVFSRTLNTHVSMTISRAFVPGAWVWLNNSKSLARIVKIEHNLGQLFLTMDVKSKYPSDTRGNLIYALAESQVPTMRAFQKMHDDEVPNTDPDFIDLKIMAEGIISISNFTELDGPFTFIPINGNTRPAYSINHEYDAVHHFQDAQGELVFPSYYAKNDFNYEGPFALKWTDVNTVQSVTYLERLQLLNEEQRSIQVIKPDAIVDVITEFKNLLRTRLNR